MWFSGILLVTFVASFVGTRIVCAVTRRYGWVAQPKSDRWHTTPTALHGGVGIFLSFLVGSVLYLVAVAGGLVDDAALGELPPGEFLRRFYVLLGASAVVFAVGLIDDIFPMKPGVKLLGELAAVSLAIFFGIGHDLTPYPWFDILLSYLWFVGIINAVNLLDNMDGVSSGIVVIGALGVALLGWIGYTSYLPVSFYLALLLAAASFGFWLNNKPPARIFMGDSGSLVLGFVFASITIPSAFNAYYVPEIENYIWDKVLQLLVAVTLAAIPILDTTLVTITRLMRGQSPSIGGKDHSTHRLAHSGLTQWQTLTILYGLSSICVLIALFMVKFPSMGFLVFGGVLVIISILAVYLATVRIQVAPIKKEGWQQLVTSVAYRVPLIKMVLDVVLIGLSLHLAYLLRFDFQLSHLMSQAMLQAMPVVVGCCLVANYGARVYEFSWRSASSRDVLHYAIAAVAGTILSLAAITLLTSFGVGYSRGAFVIFAILYFVFLSASRYSYRILDDLFLRMRMGQGNEGKIPVLIYGTDRNSKLLLDDIQHDTERWGSYRVIGLVDTTGGEFSKKVLGIPVQSAKDWQQESFQSLPEVIVADEGVNNQQVMEFAKSIDEHLRVRRFSRILSEIN